MTSTPSKVRCRWSFSIWLLAAGTCLAVATGGQAGDVVDAPPRMRCPLHRHVHPSLRPAYCSTRPAAGPPQRPVGGCPVGRTWNDEREACVCAEGTVRREGHCVTPLPDGYEPPEGWIAVESEPSDVEESSNPLRVGPRSVPVFHPFLLKATEVTQSEWRSLMGGNPSKFDDCGGDCAVDRISWYAAARYTNVLSRRRGHEECYELRGCSGSYGEDFSCKSATFEGLDCRGYRLPLESEWERAVDEEQSRSIDGYEASPHDHRVARRSPNSRGLYDMIGNVWEWTNAWYSEGYPAGDRWSAAVERADTATVIRGCERGGKARCCPVKCRFEYRPTYRDDDVGIRPARTWRP